ncbi:unnamed protein product [Withania somnifera]
MEVTSPPSLKQKLKNSLCFTCCLPHHHHHRSPPPPPPLSSSDENLWMKPDIKDKCHTIFNFNGNGNRRKRYSSAEFRYDPLSYSLNFEDEAPLKNFSSRLPPSPMKYPATVTVKHLSVAAAGL